MLGRFRLVAAAGHAILGVLMALTPMLPANAKPLDIFRDCDACPEMIELPLGSFVMGAPDSEFRQNVYYDPETQTLRLATKDHPWIPVNEGPQHKVTIDIPIAMGRNEVTYGEWMDCVQDGGCNGYVPENRIGSAGTDDAIMLALTDERFKPLASNAAMLRAMADDDFLPISGRYPVLNVSYLDAQAYVAWLNQKLGTDTYRLPSEAEWEYAARAGTTTRFAQGFEPTPEQANISGQATALTLGYGRPDLRSLPFPVPVDELDAANAWGLRHMSGNAGEVTLSCYTIRYQQWSSASEWLAKSDGKSCDRAIRGGAFANPMNAGRVAFRMSYGETTRTQYVGFRIVKDLE